MAIIGSLVFVDTETTGITPVDEIWEIAAIRREPNGAESRLHVFVEHNAERVELLPPRYRDDHEARYDATAALSREDAARAFNEFAAGVSHIVGAGIAFDNTKLEVLVHGAALAQGWHHHVIDVQTLTVGLLSGEVDIELPWRSDDLAQQLGLRMFDDNGQPLYSRHQAMDDAVWARDWYDVYVAVAARRAAERAKKATLPA